jgi:hypothetical protein
MDIKTLEIKGYVVMRKSEEDLLYPDLLTFSHSPEGSERMALKYEHLANINDTKVSVSKITIIVLDEVKNLKGN